MIRTLLLSTAVLLAAPLPAFSQEEEAMTMETCADCHDEGEAFAASPHGLAMAARDAATLARSCVGCHQPMAEHLDDPTPENVSRRPAQEACVSCHGEAAAGLSLGTPAHQRHDVACLDCHAAGHEDPGTEALLAAAAFELCGGCHQQEAGAARLPFAHRDGAEPFACTSCHSAHGGNRVGRLRLLEDGGACVDCHTDTAGPFVFPHPPREVDGCVACHEPHGSTNPRLLTRRTTLSLCLECHTDVPAFHDITSARFRSCQSCHFAVHGSNRDPRLFDD